ncbi:DUF6086 family protein [Micromonospora sp. CPCC 206060]|uniref:DUF6086 family protein n=1 Tax=Micromonospora sp. CPCC 206060 TaxID=3122406 RepID=UPI002FF24216
MGMIFTVAGEEIWDRSLNTGQMFCGQILLVEKLVGAPSGVHDTGWSEVEIDPPVLRAFLHAVFAYLDSSGSYPLRAMLRGVIHVALFLDARASGERLPVPERFSYLTEGLDLIR